MLRTDPVTAAQVAKQAANKVEETERERGRGGEQWVLIEKVKEKLNDDLYRDT